ncbi:MAG: hypothetical protein RBS13_05610 [Bacteroidales bacterium]|jgi:DNA (cytosine-5)-methyltransferase 1|nr:hypothetical protein [Bacteroidales bacterium]
METDNETLFTITKEDLQTLINHKSRHESKGNDFGYEITQGNKCAKTIVVGGMVRERYLGIDNRITNFLYY